MDLTASSAAQRTSLPMDGLSQASPKATCRRRSGTSRRRATLAFAADAMRRETRIAPGSASREVLSPRRSCTCAPASTMTRRPSRAGDSPPPSASWPRPDDATTSDSGRLTSASSFPMIRRRCSANRPRVSVSDPAWRWAAASLPLPRGPACVGLRYRSPDEPRACTGPQRLAGAPLRTSSAACRSETTRWGTRRTTRRRSSSRRAGSRDVPRPPQPIKTIANAAVLAAALARSEVVQHRARYTRGMFSGTARSAPARSPH